MKANTKKMLSMALVVALIAAIAVGGMLAYLTDRDSEANVFTMGNVEIDLTEDFQQGATLTPGVYIEKVPTIENTGKNDAWVWLTFSIPAALDEFIQGTEEGSNENVIHWNPLGATAEGYVTETRVNNAIAKGYLPEGTTAEEILAANKTWNVFNSLGEGMNVYQEEINDTDYNTYVLLYNKALEPGETTLPSIYNVYLDARVDIDPEGNWFFVENGQVEELAWNSNVNGNPVIYASAYAVQEEEFDDVQAAYKAYGDQWGDNGSEYGEAPAMVASAEALEKAIADGEKDILITEPGTYDLNKLKAGTTITGADGVVAKPLSGKLTDITVKNIEITGSDAQRWGYAGGDVTFEDCTINATGVYAIHYDGIDANTTVTYKNCDITGWVAISGDDTSKVVFDGCNIYGNGTYGVIRMYSPAVIQNCVFDVSEVDTTDVYQDGIHAVDCEIIVSNNTNVNGEMSALYNISGEGKITEK